MSAPATRIRRGKVVVIPPEWAGRTVHPQQIRKRPSKGLHKHSKLGKSALWKTPRRPKQRAARERSDER